MRRKSPRHSLAHLLPSLILSLIALPLANAATAAAQQQPNPPEAKDTTASITGRVMQAGRPASGADVVLMPSEWSSQMKAIARAKADEDGRYRMRSVPPGRYYLSPVSPGFVFAGSDTSWWMPGQIINVAAGEELKDMDFALTLGGVISGRVLDPDGKPAVAQYVTIIHADPKERKKRQDNPSTHETDDRGVYRAWGLTPGRYLVYAGRSSENNYARGDNDAGVFYPQTFYPSVTEEAQAKVLEVRAGSVAEEIDITLGKTRKTYEAAGRVLDEEGQPLAGIKVQIGSLSTDGKQMVGNISSTGPTDERGEFRAKGLMPGRWGAWGTDGDPDAGKQGNSYGDMAVFEVSDRDIGGLELKMSRGATLSGIVQIEGTSDPAILARRVELKLWVQVDAPPGTTSAPSYALGDIRPDGTFEVTGMRPGKVTFQLAWPRPKGFSLLSVRRDGIELPGGLEVRKGEHVRNVLVAYAYGTSVVRGQMQVNGGPRPTGARFFAQARRPGSTATVGWGEVDALGRFVIENLSAGEYELVLMDFSASDVPFDKRQPLARQTISVPEGGELKVTLAYDVSAAPKEDEP